MCFYESPDKYVRELQTVTLPVTDTTNTVCRLLSRANEIVLQRLSHYIHCCG